MKKRYYIVKYLSGNLGSFTHETDDVVFFLLDFWERGLELLMSLDQALDLLNRVDDEHVLEIFFCSFHPVVEWRGSLCEF